MKKDEPRSTLAGSRKEAEDPAEERMEDWFRKGVTSELEKGEVVRGRAVSAAAMAAEISPGYEVR